MVEGQSFQYMALGKVDNHMKKKEIEPISYRMYKNQLKVG